MRIAENVHLDGIHHRIEVPLLLTHGARDSQIPLHWAERTYEQLVNSPKRELKIFTEREGGVQHSSFDNSTNAGLYRRLGRRDAGRAHGALSVFPLAGDSHEYSRTRRAGVRRR